MAHIRVAEVVRLGASFTGLHCEGGGYRFNPATFDSVHFVRLREWPIDKRFGIEWVGPAPGPTQFPHYPIGLSGRELQA